MRQADIFDNRPGIAQHLAPLRPQVFQSIRHAIHPIFLWNTDGFSANITCQSRFEIGHRQVHRGAIFRIKARHRLKHDRGIAHIFGDRASLIERGGKGHNTPARATPISGLDPRDPGKCSWLADGAAGICAGGRQTGLCGHSRRRAAGRAPGSQNAFIDFPRVHRIAIDRSFIGRSHGEFIHIQLAHHNGTGVKQLL